jgi:preprotein translocase subunit SecD
MVPSFDGDISITGNFTEAETRSLAAALRYGPLPVAVRVATHTG